MGQPDDRSIVLTGGSGLVGTDICRALLADGYTVHATHRRPPAFRDPRLNWLHLDLAGDEDAWSRLPAVTQVVHAAAAVQVGPAHLLPACEANVRITNRLLEWCVRTGVTAVVYISGTNFLRRPLELPVTEQSPLAPLTPYGISKYWGEMALESLSDRIRGVSLRVSSPVPGEYGLLHLTVVKKMIDRGRLGAPVIILGSGSRTQDFVATSDIAAAVLAALSHPTARGVYNVAAGTSLSMEALARLIAEYYDVPTEQSGADPAENERWHISIERAVRELGYRPRFTSTEAVARLLTGTMAHNADVRDGG